jgi:hypothetical protein
MAASWRVFRLLSAAVVVVGVGAVAADAPKPQRIVFLGDSITHGNTLAELVHQALADAGETPPVCINAGVGGDTAAQMGQEPGEQASRGGKPGAGAPSGLEPAQATPRQPEHRL